MNTNPTATVTTITPHRVNQHKNTRTIVRSKRRVAVYCRVSTDLEIQEGSFETQISYFRTMVEADPEKELVDIYGDKGKTGRSIAARPEFQRLLADCEAGKIDMIITKSISRFARNMADCLDVLRRLRKLGITVYFEKERIHSEGTQGDMVISILAALAQHESSSISQNCLWAISEHNASGKPHFKPSYGYYKERRDWVWHIDEGQAKRVRYAFEKAAAGVCYVHIGNVLNEWEQEEQTGRIWTTIRLKNMLTNITYIGDYQTDKSLLDRGLRGKDANGQERPSYYIEGHHEPLVSKKLFDIVQDMVHSGALSSMGYAWKKHAPTESVRHK